MQEKIILPNKKDLEYYKKYNLNTFLLPLEEYSVGCSVSFNINEINTYAKEYKIYVLVNKFLHKNIDNFKEIYNKFDKSIKFIVEDIGLTSIISSDRLVLYENHILSNYKAINYLYGLGITNVVINNDLTYKELEVISKNSESNIYYFYTAKNMIMYSRRPLITSYNDHFKLNADTNNLLIREKVTNEELEISEGKDYSSVRYSKIFCASKYKKYVKSFNLIYDFSFIDELNEKMILENLDNEKLCDLIDSDYYFLENDIKYKVGDL